MNKKGFTLIEMLITVVLLATIGTIVTVNFVGLNKKTETKEDERLKNIITVAIDAYIHVEKINVNDSTTIKVANLIEEGYLTEALIGEYKNYSVIVTRTNDKALVYELKKE